MEKLINYRFDKGRLEGQSFGNLFLAAMCGISDGSGDEEPGVYDIAPRLHSRCRA